jgi:hypothetical protein
MRDPSIPKYAWSDRDRREYKDELTCQEVRYEEGEVGNLKLEIQVSSFGCGATLRHDRAVEVEI